MVALRDGRKLIGVLRSWDQFGIETFRFSPGLNNNEANEARQPHPPGHR
jgi:hypothetical protein